jgi:F-type H+-transporting ATPase subunit delta
VSANSRPSEQEIAIARVYAQAALSLAEPQGQSDEILAELENLTELMDRDPAFESFLGSPLVDTEERRAVLDRIGRGRISEILLDTLQVMNNKGRSGLARAFVEAFLQEYEELRGQVRVRVESAVPLTPALRNQLQETVSSYTGKTAKLEESVDPSLIGGLVVQVADRRIDTSVVKEIRGLGQRLLERASQEIHSGTAYFEESP